MTRKANPDNPFAAMTISLGHPDVCKERRRAYRDAAGEAGCSNLSEWVRTVLDKAAGYQEPQKPVSPPEIKPEAPGNDEPKA